MRSFSAVRSVALFEALKGAVALVAATGMLTLIHKDVHAHLNPAAKYPGIFLEAANHLQDSRILLLVG